MKQQLVAIKSLNGRCYLDDQMIFENERINQFGFTKVQSGLQYQYDLGCQHLSCWSGWSRDFTINSTLNSWSALSCKAMTSPYSYIGCRVSLVTVAAVRFDGPWAWRWWSLSVLVITCMHHKFLQMAWMKSWLTAVSSLAWISVSFGQGYSTA